MAQQQLARHTANDETSLVELFSQLAEQTGTLVKQEASLIQAELVEKAMIAGKNVGYLAVGGLIGYAGLLFILAGVVVILSYLMPFWASSVIVGAVLAISSYLLATSALTEMKKTNWAPRESIESIKEDAEWLKKQV
ncbi:phage holin family protein [soil metagenome]